MANGVIISQPVIKVIHFTHSTSVNISGNADSVITIDTFAKPTGFEPIGVLMVTSGQIQMEVVEFDGNSGKIKIKNYSSSARVVIPEMTVAFAPSNIVQTS